jgi:spermidine synthase
MLVPTTLMGATFPVVSRRLTHGMEEMGRKVGDAYSANTFGAIAGSLTAGFVLIPLAGIKWASFTGGLINITVALLIMAVSRKGGIRKVAAISVLAALSGGVLIYNSDMKYPTATFYQASLYKDFENLKEMFGKMEVLSSKDYAEGHVIAYRGTHGFTTIQIGGKMEGTSPVDVPNTVMLAALPAALFSQKPEDVIVLGLGSGVTTWTMRKLSRNMDVVEINPGVVEAVDKFGLIGTLNGANVFTTDARKHLYYTDKQYDVITSGTSVPSETAAGNLFTREFYEIAVSKLKKGGILCQQLPGWMLTTEDSLAPFKTFSSVFENVYIWFVTRSQDFIMAGSNGPFRLGPEETAERAMDIARSGIPVEWRESIEAEGVDFRELFNIRFIGDNETLQAAFQSRDIPIITDDRSILEFIVARRLLAATE